MGAVSCHWLWLAGGCGVVGDEESNLVGTCRNKRCRPIGVASNQGSR